MNKNIIFEAIEEFLKEYKGEKIIIYGSGRIGELLFYALESFQLQISYFVDGDENKQGSCINGVEIRSPYDLLYENRSDILVLIGLNDNEQPRHFLEENKIPYRQLHTAHMNKKPDLLDPFLGYTREDDILGFKMWCRGGQEENEIRIVTLGGSTTDYSFGCFNSWPFYLYENYVKNNICCKVYNGGIIGYYSGQELLKLLRDVLILAPDIVICYSGMNDAVNLYRAEQYSLINSYLKNTMNDLSTSEKISFGLQQEIKSADNWLKNMRIMHAICSEFGISFYSFLQPNAYTGNYIMTDQEKQVFEKCDKNKINQEEFYECLVPRLKGYSYIFDLTRIFDDKSGIFFDTCHVSEEGNKIIANEIYNCISCKNEKY